MICSIKRMVESPGCWSPGLRPGDLSRLEPPYSYSSGWAWEKNASWWLLLYRSWSYSECNSALLSSSLDQQIEVPFSFSCFMFRVNSLCRRFARAAQVLLFLLLTDSNPYASTSFTRGIVKLTPSGLVSPLLRLLGVMPRRVIYPPIYSLHYIYHKSLKEIRPEPR